jgi:hypothetical protein
MTSVGETGLNYPEFIERLLIKGELVGHSISSVNVMACVLSLRTRTRGWHLFNKQPACLVI